MSVTVLWYQMDATVSELTKMCQNYLKSVVALKSEAVTKVACAGIHSGHLEFDIQGSCSQVKPSHITFAIQVIGRQFVWSKWFPGG